MILSHIVQQAVVDVYTAGASREKWKAALQRLREAFQATAVVVAPCDYQANPCGWVLQCGNAPGVRAHCRARDAPLDPQGEGWHRQRGPGGCGAELVVTEAVRSEVRGRNSQPSGHDQVLRAVVDRNGSTVIYVTVWRDRRAEPFGDPELDALRYVARHLRGALQAARDLEAKSVRLSAFIATLDSMAQAAILTDGQSWWHGNRSAMRLLEAGNGLRLRRCTLEATDAHQREQLRGLLRRARDPAGPAAGTLILARGPDRRPLLVTAIPVSDPCTLFEEHPRYALLLIGDPEERKRPAPAVLRQWFGLTVAEAKLAGLLAGGLRLEEAAEALGISVGTARNHLKGIFAKTDTHRQADLIALIASMPVVSIAEEARAYRARRVRTWTPAPAG